jgi:acetyltransferase-like isoleucine patch superfamily enzyme
MARRAAVRTWRIGWTVTTLVGVQAFVCGLAALPVVFAWRLLFRDTGQSPLVRLLAYSVALLPSYVLFALGLLVVSPLALRAVGWRTSPDMELRMTDLDWPLLQWVRHAASLHLVRVIAGTLFRGTPVWTAYLRLSGARFGKRVYVNSLSVSDYNLLECGDDVVIGDGVHLSGHTVEAGVVKTARVRLGSNVTIGLGSVIEIGVEIGDGAQIGALSFVPKYTRLEGGRVYVGAPAAPLERPAQWRRNSDTGSEGDGCTRPPP